MNKQVALAVRAVASQLCPHCAGEIGGGVTETYVFASREQAEAKRTELIEKYGIDYSRTQIMSFE